MNAIGTYGTTLAIALAAQNAIPTQPISPGLLWTTLLTWGTVALLLASLTGIVASRARSERTSRRDTPSWCNLSPLCSAGAH